MRKILCLILIFHGLSKTSYSQSIFRDTLVNYRVATTYSLFSIREQLRDKEGFGPWGIEAQRFITDNFSLGLQYNLQKRPYSATIWDLAIDQNNPIKYIGSARESQFLIKGNYYLTFKDAESRVLQSFKIYGSIGLGAGFSRSFGVSDSLYNGAFQEKELKNQYFVAQLTVGAEYEFLRNFGVHLEAGYALSWLQFGVFYKF